MFADDRGLSPDRIVRSVGSWPQGGSAMAMHLRVYPSPDDAPNPRAQTVRVCLADLLPLIALAHRHNYAWLQDFLDDEVRISEDLYEVLQAFRAYRPSA
jgi:hypothetical protein